MSPVKQIFGSIVPSTATGLAKASPGIGVGGLYIAGVQIADWVSVLTCIYIIFMMIGAIPKLVDGLRYLRHWRTSIAEKSLLVVRVMHENGEVNTKMECGKNADQGGSGGTQS